MASNPVPCTSMNPTGHYTISTDPGIGPQLTTTAFTLILFYSEETHDSKPKGQLHGKFIFGTLVGRMRLCPFSAYPRGKKFTIDEFEKACDLERGSMPSPEKPNWLMGGRGRDGGMRQEERVGGEENVQSVFDFTFDVRDDGVGAVRIEFAMPYRGKVFAFSGTKVRELDGGEGGMDWEDVEHRWNRLRDWLGGDSEEEETLLDEMKVLPGGEVSLEMANKYLTAGLNQWKHLVDSSDSE